MSERTRQEIFDIAYQGLAAQEFKQSKGGVGCAYRGYGGLKCAVGHLIEDANYHEDLEGIAADAPEVMRAARMSDNHCQLLADMQGAHDGGDLNFIVSPDEMKERLSKVAAKHGLTVPQVTA